jgi:capsular polysaccharide biosynthesis protein
VIPEDNELNPNDEELEIDFRQILKTLGKWSRFIIGLTLLVGLAAGLISHFVLTPIYQADTLLRFSQATEKLQTNPNAAVTPGSELDAYTKPVLTMNTHLAQIKSRALMQRITDALKLEGYAPVGLAGMIEASIVKDSNLIQVKVQNSDPVLAAKIANTLSDQYLQLLNEKTQEQINSSVTFLSNQKEITKKQLAEAQAAYREYSASPTGAALTEKEDLQREINRLNQALVTLDGQIASTLIARSVDLGDSSMVVMSAAAAPTSPIKPNQPLNVAIAIVLGLILFTLLAFVLEYLDNTVKSTESFREMDLTVLGVIPKDGSHKRSRSKHGGY